MASALLPLTMTYRPSGTASNTACASISPTRTLSNVMYSAFSSSIRRSYAITGTPASIALATAGLTAVPSWARTTRTLAPWEMRFSMLLAWVSADDLASFEM